VRETERGGREGKRRKEIKREGDRDREIEKEKENKTEKERKAEIEWVYIETMSNTGIFSFTLNLNGRNGILVMVRQVL